MSLTMYDVSVPAMLRGFDVLLVYIDKASAFAREKGLDPATLVQAKLAPDMLGFGGQIQRASDKVKNGVARLTGVDAPKFADTETTFDELRVRIEKTVDFVRSVDAQKFEGSESRLVDLGLRAVRGSFRGDAYLLTVLLPDFYFHVTTAHDILRNQGVQVGKLDYFGPL